MFAPSALVARLPLFFFFVFTPAGDRTSSRLRRSARNARRSARNARAFGARSAPAASFFVFCCLPLRVIEHPRACGARPAMLAPSALVARLPLFFFFGVYPCGCSNILAPAALGPLLAPSALAAGAARRYFSFFLVYPSG
jgi:hypothetical protein